VHAHQHLVLGRPLALGERQVQAAGAVGEADALELALGGHQGAAAQALDQRFVAAAVFDEVGDGADLQRVLPGEDFEVRQARHRAVVLHDLADHGRRCEAGHAGEVAAGLGVPGAHQHAAVLRLQREDVAGLHQIGRLRRAVHCRLHGACAVGGGDAGGHAGGRFDGDRECRAVPGAVARGHRRQLQALAAFARERQADQAAAEARHEVDRLGRDMVGGEHQIALVFAVFLVDEDDHAASGELGDKLWNRGDRHS